MLDETEVQKWLDDSPTFAQDEHNSAACRAFLKARGESASLVDLAVYINSHPAEFHWLATDAVETKVDMKRALANGDLGVRPQTWRADRDDVAAKEASEKEEKRKAIEADPKNIAKAKASAELLASSAMLNNNHAVNADFRKKLAQVFAHRSGVIDWFETLKARQEVYNNATDSSIGG